METPLTAQFWKRHWFACPHCGFRARGAHVLLNTAGIRYGGSLVPYRFWCPNCGGYSVSAHPILFVCALLAAQIALFLVTYIHFFPLGWLTLIPILILGFLGPIGWIPLLSWLVNRYVPLDPTQRP